MSGANQLPEITLDELERLIRMLGMLGSASDSEALVAARFAVKWVREHDTDWKTLLTPPAEANPVVGVTAVPDASAMAQAYEADRVQAYANGYQAGLRAMMTQLKAQAAMGQAAAAQAPPQPQSRWAHSFSTLSAGLGGGLGGAAAAAPPAQGRPGQPAQAAPGGSGGGAGRVWPAGSWQAVCQELLDRHAQGIPGVLRSREEQFVQDVLARGFPTLTPAQETWLRDIAGRNGLSW